MFKIQSGVPLPARVGGRPTVFPLAQMNVGDSFTIPVEPSDDIARVAHRAYDAVKYYRRTHDTAARFAVRRLDDHVGVWRIA